jgi:hypothetical protein
VWRGLKEFQRSFLSRNKLPRPQGGALKPKFSKPKTEIPKQVRDDKRRRPIPCCHEPCAELDSVSFQHLIRFSLPLADTPFIPVHRTGFSGAISNKMERVLLSYSHWIIELKFRLWVIGSLGHSIFCFLVKMQGLYDGFGRKDTMMERIIYSVE